MPIIITRESREGYPDKIYTEEVSLLKVFDMQDEGGYGQVETLTSRVNSLSNFIQNFLESIPEGRKYLTDYLKNSYINGIDRYDRETKINYKEEGE